jgi:hypothetical protein
MPPGPRPACPQPQSGRPRLRRSFRVPRGTWIDLRKAPSGPARHLDPPSEGTFGSRAAPGSAFGRHLRVLRGTRIDLRKAPSGPARHQDRPSEGTFGSCAAPGGPRRARTGILHGPGGVFRGLFPSTSSLGDRRCVRSSVPRTLFDMRFLRDINASEMLALTDQWTGPIKPVFVSIPELAPLLPRVQEDHDALLTARAGSPAEALLRTLAETADLLDERHDHLHRALH